MKRGLLGFPLLILLTQVISAQFYSGYGGFSLTNFFDRMNPSTIILVLVFLIFFALIFYALSKFFKGPYGQPNKGIAGVMAFATTSLIIYGLYRTGFDLGSIFYNLGFSVDFLYPILAIIILVFAILIIRSLGRTKKDEFGRRTFSLRRGLGGFFMVFGLFIILLTIFTDIFYEKGITLIIGIVSLVIGLLLWRRRRRRRLPNYQPSPQERERMPPMEVLPPSTRRSRPPRRRLSLGRKFQYSQGMRRGGLKSTRGKFVSRRATERYARRFGKGAAKKRFGR